MVGTRAYADAAVQRTPPEVPDAAIAASVLQYAAHRIGAPDSFGTSAATGTTELPADSGSLE